MTDDQDSGDPFVLWDAAYVLGALTSTERREYESHLTVCGSCRSEVNDLSGMPALLAMLSPAEVAAIDDGGLPPTAEQPQLIDEILLTVRRRRRKVRWMTWSVAAAAALVIGLGAAMGIRLVSIETGPTPSNPASIQTSSRPMTMTAVAPSALQATVSLSSVAWGTTVEMECTYHESGDDSERLELIAVSRDGMKFSLATWVAVAGGTAHPSGSTAIPLDQIAEVQVVVADTGEVLLRRNL